MRSTFRNFARRPITPRTASKPAPKIMKASPGPQRPLTKPDHFQRFLGLRARVRLREPREGHKSFTGELVGASDSGITVAADEGIVSIPYSDINRSNLLEGEG